MDVDKNLITSIPDWALKLDPSDMLNLIDFLNQRKGEVIHEDELPSADSGSVNATVTILSVMGEIEEHGKYYVIPEDFELPNQRELCEDLQELQEQLD